MLISKNSGPAGRTEGGSAHVCNRGVPAGDDLVAKLGFVGVVLEDELCPEIAAAKSVTEARGPAPSRVMSSRPLRATIVAAKSVTGEEARAFSRDDLAADIRVGVACDRLYPTGEDNVRPRLAAEAGPQMRGQGRFASASDPARATAETGRRR